MAYEDHYRLSVHAVILDSQSKILMLKTTYGGKDWTLPGGAIDPGETIHETLHRECKEELNCEIEIVYLSGVYYHKVHNSQAFVFLCRLKDGSKIELSSEHSEFCYFPVDQLKESHQIKVRDCLRFDRLAFSNKF